MSRRAFAFLGARADELPDAVEGALSKDRVDLGRRLWGLSLEPPGQYSRRRADNEIDMHLARRRRAARCSGQLLRDDFGDQKTSDGANPGYSEVIGGFAK